MTETDRLRANRNARMRWKNQPRLREEQRLRRASKRSTRTYRGRAYDLTGEVFGRLTAVRVARDGGKNKRRFWECICVCGKTVIVNVSHLTSEVTRSCGCLRHLPPTTQLDYGQSSFNSLLSKYISGAEERGYDWLLTDDEAMNLFIDVCFYCGCQPRQIAQDKGANGPFIYNGIDRLDNAGGYTVDNTVTSCGVCNFAKGKRSVAEFIEWVTLVHNYSNRGHT